MTEPWQGHLPISGPSGHASPVFQRWLGLLPSEIPSGTVATIFATAEPEGWLFLDGQTVDTGKFPDLAAALGETGATMTLPNEPVTHLVTSGAVNAIKT